MRKFSNLYSEYKIKCNRKTGFYYETNNGYLYSGLIYKTKIKPEDLPEYFIKGYIYKRQSYISTKGVKDLAFKACYFVNHFLKDDSLYISYDKDIKFKEGYFGYPEAYDYDYIIGGAAILDFIKSVEIYSNYDTSNIKKEIKRHALYYDSKYHNGELNYKEKIYPEIIIPEDEINELLKVTILKGKFIK